MYPQAVVTHQGLMQATAFFFFKVAVAIVGAVPMRKTIRLGL